MRVKFLTGNASVQRSITACALLLATISAGCNSRPTPAAAGKNEKSAALPMKNANLETRRNRLSDYPASLADYGLFRHPLRDLQPAEGVIEYELNTPLFSDYSQKQRLVKLPVGTSAKFKANGSLDFPVGTIIAKTFYYASDLSDPMSPRRIVETRILERRDSGWIGIPYLWNDEQTEAQLAIAGASVDVTWRHTDGEMRTNTHLVPNLNDCKRCHTNLTMEPIGPKANNLNRDLTFEGKSQNQLARWEEIGILTGLPELNEIPRLAIWDDKSFPLDHRARAYLEVNCAHCHNPIGPARSSGLHLNIEETNSYHFGTFKTPVAAGKGTGGRLYGIVPGKPEESILEYRMQTIQTGEIMPEFGKTLIHEEGLALIREWIAEMR
jgi:uncharacterized repeat protein (TIGR03806 family)